MATFHEFIQTIPRVFNADGSLDAKQMGYRFEPVARYFFQHLYEAPGYLIENVQRFNDWGDYRWAKKERGTDFICEVQFKNKKLQKKKDKNRVNIFACQAKFYSQNLVLDPNYPNSKFSETGVSEQDIKNFFGDAFVGNELSDVVEYFIITTTNKIDKDGKDYLRRIRNEHNINIIFIDRSDLERYVWPASYEDLKASLPEEQDKEPLELRSYQKEAITQVQKYFKTNSRGLLTMACGTGKTLLGVKIHEALKSTRTLIVFPTIKLLKDTMWEWHDQRIEDFEIISIASDHDVINKNEKKDADDLHYDDMDASNIGVPTTNPEDISKKLDTKEPLVVFSTYHSTPRIQEAFQANPTLQPFELIIADEAHHLATRLEDDDDGRFITLIHDENIPGNKRLYMTATPKVYRGKSKKDDVIEYSMDDTSMFGTTIFSYSFREAVRDKWLNKFEIDYLIVDDEETFEQIKENVEIKIDETGRYAAHRLAIMAGIFQLTGKFKLRKMLTFHTSIKDADDFSTDIAVLFQKLALNKPSKKLDASHVSGKLGLRVINGKVNNLEYADSDTLAVVSSARVLLEGVDVPAIDSIAFVNPKKISTDIVQAIGRAIRKPRDMKAKEQGTSHVLVPIVIDRKTAMSLETEEDFDEYVKENDPSFRQISNIRAALSEMDETYWHSLKVRRRTKRKGKGGESDDEFFHNYAHLDNFDKFRKSIDARSLNLTTSRWDESFGELERYALTTTDSMLELSRDFVYEDVRLDSFVNHQRELVEIAENGQITIMHPMTEERKELLEGLVNKKGEKCWEWEPYKAKFERQCVLIETMDEQDKQIDKNGILQILSTTHRIQRSFLTKCRKDYRNNKLEDWQIKRLKKIPGAFKYVNMSKPKINKSQQHYNNCADYYKKHDHMRLPQIHASYNWLNGNRARNSELYQLLQSTFPKVFDHRGEHGELTELFYYIDEALALPEINSVLDIKADAASADSVSIEDAKIDGAPPRYLLGSRISTLRSDNNDKEKKKTKEFEILKEIILEKYSDFFEFKSNVLQGKDSASWIDHVGFLKEYRAEFGHIFLKSNEKYKGIALGYWLVTQQRNFKDLSDSDQDLITDLNDIGMMDNGCQSMMWNRVDRFRKDESHYAFLQMLGISTSNEEFFRNNYAQQILDFKKNKGHVLVSADSYQALFNYLKQMRLHYKNKVLTVCEIEFLERVGRTNTGKQSMIWDESKLPKTKTAKQLFIEELLRE